MKIKSLLPTLLAFASWSLLSRAAKPVDPPKPVAQEYRTLLFSPNSLTNDLSLPYSLHNYSGLSLKSAWLSAEALEEPGIKKGNIIRFTAARQKSYKRLEPCICSINYTGTNISYITDMNINVLCNWDQDGEIPLDTKCSGDLYGTPSQYRLERDWQDDDVLTCKANSKAYCLEVLTTNELCLSATLRAGTYSNCWRITGSSEKKNEGYRLYITNAVPGETITWRIKPGTKDQLPNDLAYDYVLRHPRPLILVHGIRSEPKNENERKAGLTAFGNLPKKLSACKDIYPSLVLDFPWNANSGNYKWYCGSASREGTLNNRSKLFCDGWKLNPVFLAHSMGGILLAEQLTGGSSIFKEPRGLMFIGSPFFGSDTANLFATKGNVAKRAQDQLDFGHVSNANLRHLARGSKHVWERYQQFQKLNKFSRIRIVAGNSIHDSLTGVGDYRVNVSSAIFSNTLELNATILKMSLEHSELVDFALPNDSLRILIVKELNDLLEK